MSIDTKIREEILGQIKLIEEEHDVRVLMAIESGSRAWGFSSADSDYDVRFVYVHKPEWYLRVFPQRDVIEVPIDPVLDINGWELRKSLQLLCKSNGALTEWINSPVTYVEDSEFRAEIMGLQKALLNPRALFHHYFSMARGKYEVVSTSDEPRLKDYFYLLRAALCCEYLIRKGSTLPVLFSELLADYCQSHTSFSLGSVIDEWLEQKKRATEKNTIPRNTAIDGWIEVILDNAEKNPPEPENKSIKSTKLDALLFSTVY